MKTPFRSILTASIAALCVGLTAHRVAAQTITWGAATTMSADADVITTGAADRAYIFGSAGAVNGVTFSNFQSNGFGDSVGAGMVNYPGAAYAANGGAFPNYANLSTAYKDIARFGVYADGGGGSVTLNALNSGLDYQLQVWVNDSREFGGAPIAARTGSIGGSPTLDYNVQNDTGGVGQFAVGTFTATGASTALNVSANASAQINALQLRATGVSAGGAATVTAPQQWSALTVGAGGSLNYAIGSDFTTSTVISGAGSLGKSGAGVLTLNRAQSYGGATNISGGTLRLAPAASAAVAGASRQFDASALGLGNGAAVTQWNDLSGNGANATVPGDQSNTAPTYLTDAGTGTGLGAISFAAGGGATTSQALTFTQDAAIRSVFSIFKGSSFVLTDRNAYYFHRPGDSNPADPLVANYGQAGPFISGSTYVNGAAVDPQSTPLPTNLHNGYNLVEFITSGNVSADGFNRDRIFHSGNQSQAEVLIYDFALSNAQRLQNESYLNYKWFGIGATSNILPTTTAVNISNGGTLDLGGGPQTIASLAGTDASGTAVALGAGRLTVGDATNTTFDGAISGAGGITKQGNGTLKLAGANTFTGTTLLNAGKLFVNGSLAAGSAVTVASGTTLGGSGTIAGAVGVNAGGILESGNGAGNGTLTIGTLTLSGAATLNVTPGGAAAINVTGANGLSANGGAGSATINIVGVPAGVGTYTLVDYAGTLGGGFGKFALGTLPSRVLATLANNAGNTSIDLNVTGTDLPVWKGTLGTAWTAATLAAEGAPNNWVLNSNNTSGTNFLPNDNVVFGDLPVTTSVTVDVSAADVSPATVTFNNATRNYTLTGSKAVAGATGIAKSGTGTVTLANANTFTGAVAIGAGTLRVGNAAALGSTAGGTSVSGGATLDLNGQSVGAEPVSLAGSGIGAAGALVNSSATAASLAGDIALAANATVGGTGAVTLSGVVGGGFALTKTGANAVTLSGANTFSGGLTMNSGTLTLSGASTFSSTVAINGGTVILGNGAGLGSTAGGTIVNAGTLDLNGQAVGAEPVGLSGTGIGGNGALVNSSATPASLAGQVAIVANASVGGTGDTTLSGVLLGGATLTKIGNGTLTLSGTSSHNGGIVVSGGTLKTGSNQGLGALNNVITVNSGATLDLGSAELFSYTTPITINGSGVGGVGAIYKSTTPNGALQQLRGIVLGSDASIGGVATSRIDIGRGDWTGPGPGAPIHIDGQGHFLAVTGGTYLGILAESQNLAGVIVRTGSSVAPHNDNSLNGAPIVLDGGTLTPWNNHTFSDPIVVTTNGGFIDNQGFFQTYTGAVQIDGATQINTIVGGNITLAGNVSGNGAITKIGGYSLFLSGDNSGYTGTFTTNESNTFFGAGTGGSAGAAFVVNASYLSVSVGGVLSVDLGSLAGSGGAIGNNNPGGAVTFSIGGKNTNTVYNGGIVDTNGGGGTTAITKVGTGTLTLNGTLSYTDVTNINSGTLNVNSALGAGANVVNANGGNTNFSVSETLAALNIGNGAVVTIGPAAPAPALPFEQGAAFDSGATAVVPEPGALALLFAGALGMLGRRRRG